MDTSPALQNNTPSRRNILLGGTALAASSVIAVPAPGRAERRPNILVIFADGQTGPSLHGVLDDRKPNIGRIAREGMMFTDYYAEHNWAASWSSIITGQLPLRTGLSKESSPAAPAVLPKEVPSIADLLKPLGYTAGQFGETPVEAMNFIGRQAEASHPFFCWFSITRTTAAAGEAGGMAGLDGQAGLLLKKLDDLGIANNTLVLYTAAGAKGALRVPCLIRWPGRIKAGQVSNEIISGLDWLPTFLAAAGEPDVKDKLLKGYSAAGKTFKVHLDGYNQLPYLLGQRERSARKEFFTFNDGGDLTGMRYENWKIAFEEPPADTVLFWGGPSPKIHLPKFFDVRSGCGTRTDWAPDNGYDWFISHPSLMFAARAEATKFLATFKAFPPPHNAAGFSLDKISAKVRYALTIG